MKLNPYLMFNGQCEAAFKFYSQVLGGKVEGIMTYGSSPMADKMPAMRDKVMHARLVFGDNIVMGADAPPDRVEKPQGFSMAIGLNDTAEAERIFKALAQNGTVQMPLQETFWAVRFGMVVDQFGIPWMVNCEKAE